MNINNVVLSGFMGSNPDPFKYGEGKMGIRFSFASSEKVKDEYQSTWFQVTLFGKMAEIMQDKIAKGDKVLIIGRIGSNDYTSKDGIKKTSIKITASTVEVLKKKEQKVADHAQEKSYDKQDFVDDSLPF